MRKKIIFNMPIFQTGGTERVLVNVIKALNDDYDIYVIIKNLPTKCALLDQLYAFNIKVFCLAELFPALLKPKSFLQKIYWKLFSKRCAFKKSLKFIESLCDKDTLWVDFLCFSFFDYAKSLPKNLQKWCWMHCSSDVFWKKKNLKKLYAYHKVISINNTFTENVKSGLPNLPIRTILNPFDIQTIYEQSLSDNISDDNFFVYVGRISKDKDIVTLIQAYNKFVAKTKSLTKLFLIGTGEKLEEYQELAKNLHLEKNIVFKGNQANPFPWMRCSKALILSSLSEGSPMVLLEAMISQTIPVSSDCVSGPREMLDNGKRGVLFEPQNVEELALIMEKVDMGIITKEQFQSQWSDFIELHSINGFKINFNEVLNEKN